MTVINQFGQEAPHEQLTGRSQPFKWKMAHESAL